jgi:hypothetical protein
VPKESDPDGFERSYRPPPGFKPSKPGIEAKEFDWDEVNDDPDLEIWAIRLPLGVSGLTKMVN